MPAAAQRAASKPTRRLRVRIMLAPGMPFGPGKADLLEGIAETGSIAAAARRMGMSYQRAWDLVTAMNTHFRCPVLAASKGGARGGGAVLTPFGAKVLETYRTIERKAAQACSYELRWLHSRRAAKA